MPTEIVRNTDRHRYEICVNGELAGYVEYQQHSEGGSDTIVFSHTEIRSAFRGSGLAAALTRHVLDEAQRDGLAVQPLCPFVASFVRKNPEYLALVPEDQHSLFNL